MPSALKAGAVRAFLYDELGSVGPSPAPQASRAARRLSSPVSMYASLSLSTPVEPRQEADQAVRRSFSSTGPPCRPITNCGLLQLFEDGATAPTPLWRGNTWVVSREVFLQLGVERAEYLR